MSTENLQKHFVKAKRWRLVNVDYRLRFVSHRLVIRAQGINIAPLVCLALTCDKPTGSMEAGIRAFSIALNIMSLSKAWWMCIGGNIFCMQDHADLERQLWCHTYIRAETKTMSHRHADGFICQSKTKVHNWCCNQPVSNVNSNGSF